MLNEVYTLFDICRYCILLGMALLTADVRMFKPPGWLETFIIVTASVCRTTMFIKPDTLRRVVYIKALTASVQ